MLRQLVDALRQHRDLHLWRAGVSLAGLLDDRRRLLLSHTAGCRPESLEPLPRECTGLWSYSNAGYQEAASGFDSAYADALRELVLDPLGLRRTSFETPADGVLG